MSGIEANFDGLVGPTHHYAGLSIGNEASLNNKNQTSNPKQAALQGLNKMKALSDMGFVQGILPPQPRPNLEILRQIGFQGSPAAVIAQAAKHPFLLSAFSSASSMWTANAATVSPSADSLDHRVHFTVANLNNKLHRHYEAAITADILRATFNNPDYFAHHEALPSHGDFGDEGAANHNRFCADYDQPGIQLFVYGRQVTGNALQPQRYPARQTREASEAIARLHQLSPENTFYAQQNPAVIDQGVFHNDVISVSNQNVFFYHQQAFVNSKALLTELQRASDRLAIDFKGIEVPQAVVSVEDAVASYLFNSQLLTTREGVMSLIVPEECRQKENVWAYLQALVENQQTPIRAITSFDLRESMRNGGGPACLRLRVALSKRELNAVNPHSLMTQARYDALKAWVNTHYRDRFSTQDLADPQLIDEVHTALDELTTLLSLGSVYAFQR
ncbi:N-succinylarginine dihydrolase [Tatumella ptyseos]|uniref:N-succinylarginine dihydrolase n=1 Tax=Tatumella ptyseos TaxID=82987 RepID=UPI0026EDE0D8|nr:N-succinylarginine dihydrolase [Tatumella ptyseos]WKX27662.1 N-succinylarginine dihydrolase [Tatumella ptyseos]